MLGRFSSFNSLLVCIGSVQPSKPWRSGKRAQVCGSVGTVKRTKPRTLRWSSAWWSDTYLTANSPRSSSTKNSLAANSLKKKRSSALKGPPPKCMRNELSSVDRTPRADKKAWRKPESATREDSRRGWRGQARAQHILARGPRLKHIRRISRRSWYALVATPVLLASLRFWSVSCVLSCYLCLRVVHFCFLSMMLPRFLLQHLQRMHLLRTHEDFTFC